MTIDEIFTNPNETLNDRRILAKEEGNEAKYAYLTDYLGFPTEGDHMYNFGKKELESNPKLIEKIEHEINYVIFGKEKYENMLSEQKEKDQKKIQDYSNKKFLEEGGNLNSNLFYDRFAKERLLKTYFPDRFGENGTAFQNKGTKNSLSEYKDVGIGKLFEKVYQNIKKDYK